MAAAGVDVVVAPGIDPRGAYRMFTVTSEAAAALRSMLDEADDRPEDHTFRIGYDETARLGLVWDEPANEDHHIQVNNETVLLVDEDVWNRLDDVIMDVVETDEGPQLTLQRKAG